MIHSMKRFPLGYWYKSTIIKNMQSNLNLDYDLSLAVQIFPFTSISLHPIFNEKHNKELW